ncbi:aminoglycoside phosphotransferase (APT) family kinase protein [Nocardiopsis mwathae]|uniref:Aminoglycoside phosphotransferase (APT) family kinase protein n=1 Tax=Nocardiopsis mwathae TaxID=1472723 RepID=A0A7W9YM38_9ACTN|nr:class V lanthionine synthetase subunit LxmK [Nocardiopsis mwathae]MBB6174685.1 aminoglycoside phosphotransferase (APT) family kinase protein [Nocardiopsis mwathae]
MIGSDVTGSGASTVRVDQVQDTESIPPPEVAALVEHCGPEFADAVFTVLPGRNRNWKVKTREGRSVLVKRIHGADADDRFARALAAHRYIAEAGAPMRTPRLLAASSAVHLLVFTFINQVESGANLAARGAFDDATAYRFGAALARLHAAPLPKGEPATRAPHPLPPVDDLRAIPLRRFSTATAGLLECWKLMQGDTRLREALIGLRTAEAQAPLVPCHGDIRLDQLLVGGDEPLVIDWEEFRSTDAARDVGAFAGEWLYLAMREMDKPGKGAEALVEVEPTHDVLLARGGAALRRLRSRTAAFWSGYRQVRGQSDEGFRTRAAGFAGWHMFDRLLATAAQVPRLSALDRACAGVGRTVLLSPDESAELIGLEAS